MLLTQCIENPENSWLFKEPLPELIEGKPEYEVEEILNARQTGQGHKLQYLVKWKGYSAAHNSWEPCKYIHALALLKEFYKRQPKAIKTIRISFENSKQTPMADIPTITTLNTPGTVLAAAYHFWPSSEETKGDYSLGLFLGNTTPSLCYPSLSLTNIIKGELHLPTPQEDL